MYFFPHRRISAAVLLVISESESKIWNLASQITDQPHSMHVFFCFRKSAVWFVWTVGHSGGGAAGAGGADQDEPGGPRGGPPGATRGPAPHGRGGRTPLFLPTGPLCRPPQVAGRNIPCTCLGHWARGGSYPQIFGSSEFSKGILVRFFRVLAAGEWNGDGDGYPSHSHP